MAEGPAMHEIAGCEVAVERRGAGPPLLFLHGAGGPGWLPFLDALATRFDVIAPAHPGFGRSALPDWLNSVGDLAYFYLDFLEALGLDRVHVVASSLGGWIALELAVRNTQRLATLTLAAPAGLHVKGVRKAEAFLVPPAELAHSLYHDPDIAARAAAQIQDLSSEQEDIQIKNRSTTARLAWQPYFYNPALKNWLHRITLPTLIVWGRDDRMFPPAHAEPLRDMIPGARLVLLDSCGHLPHVEKKDDFVAHVVKFIEESGR